MSKRPWMPLYIGDYIADTQHLNATQSGAYLHLIMYYWQHRQLPKDERSLSRIARIDARQWHLYRDTLLGFFCVDSGGNRTHKRIDNELLRSDEISNKRKAAALQKHKKSDDLPLQLHTQSQSQRKKEKKESCMVAKATHTESMFDVFWRRYPKRKGGNPKAPAEKLFSAAVKTGVLPGHIIEAIESGAGFDREKIGTEYIPQAVKWLRDKRWQEHTPADPQLTAERARFMAARGYVWMEGKWQKTEEPQEVRFGEGEV